MKKSKHILLFKIFIILVLLIYIRVYNLNFKSKYKNENIIYGYVEKYYIKDETLTIYLKGKEKILCTIYNYRLNNIKVGDYLKLEGNFKNVNNNTIFNTFNYKEYLKYEHISYIFNIKNIDIIKRNKSVIYRLKNKIIQNIEKKENKEYLYTFILGVTKYLNNEVVKSYRINGISHLFSVSGMHVSLISLIILKIFNKYKFKDMLVIIIILFYMFLTNFSPSILRAGLFFVLNILNKKLNINISHTNLMYVLLIICIILDPFIINKIGFQYSFIIAYFLIRFKSMIKMSENRMRQIFITSFIAFVASLPITINNFNQINLLTVFINVLFIPFVSLFMFPLVLISYIVPIPFLKCFIDMFENISLLISRVDCFIFTMKKVSIFIIVIYYLIIYFVLTCVEKRDYKKISIIVFMLIIHYVNPYMDSSYKIVYLDVKQADSIFIKYPYNKFNILIDTGGSVTSNLNTSQNLIDYFKSLGVNKLNYLILTHGDYDHMGEAINLVKNFKVKKVIFNCGEFNDLESELVKVLDKKKIPYYSCIKELNIGDNKLYFLQTSVYDNENDNSNVIYTEIDGYKFMFMGDAGIEKEKDILDKYNISDVDVLKVGHHGSKTSSSKVFINEMNPKYSVISVGKNNRYGHPNKEVLDNLNDSKVYRTDQDGSIMLKIKNNKLKIETCSP